MSVLVILHDGAGHPGAPALEGAGPGAGPGALVARGQVFTALVLLSLRRGCGGAVALGAFAGN